MAKFDPKRYKVDNTSLSQLSRLSTAHLQSVLKYWSRIGNDRAKRIMEFDPHYSSLLSFNQGGKFGKSGVYKDRTSTLNELQRIKAVAPNLTKKKALEESRVIKNLTSDYRKKYTPIYISTIRNHLRIISKKVKESTSKVKDSKSKNTYFAEVVAEKMVEISEKLNYIEEHGTIEGTMNGEVFEELEGKIEELRAMLPQKEFAGLLPAMISENRFRRGFALFKEKHLNISADIYDKLKSTVMKMNDRYVYHIEDLIDRLYEEYQEEVNQALGDTLPDDSLPW